MMYSIRLDNDNYNYHLNFGKLPKVGEWAQYGNTLYKVVSVGAHSDMRITTPVITCDHRRRKE